MNNEDKQICKSGKEKKAKSGMYFFPFSICRNYFASLNMCLAVIAPQQTFRLDVDNEGSVCVKDDNSLEFAFEIFMLMLYLSKII